MCWTVVHCRTAHSVLIYGCDTIVRFGTVVFCLTQNDVNSMTSSRPTIIGNIGHKHSHNSIVSHGKNLAFDRAATQRTCCWNALSIVSMASHLWLHKLHSLLQSNYTHWFISACKCNNDAIRHRLEHSITAQPCNGWILFPHAHFLLLRAVSTLPL